MSNETLVDPSHVGPNLEGRRSDEMSRKGTVLMLLKLHHEHRPPCQVGIKRDLGTVASIGGTCVSLSRTRSLEVDNKLPGPSRCPFLCHPWGPPCASGYRAQNGGSHIQGFWWRRGGAHTPSLREMSAESYRTFNLASQWPELVPRWLLGVASCCLSLCSWARARMDLSCGCACLLGVAETRGLGERVQGRTMGSGL